MILDRVRDRVRAAMLAGAAVVAVLPAPARAETWESLPVNPRVDIAYIAPTDNRLTDVYEQLKGRKILEELQHFLSPLHLPHRLTLRTVQCGQINAFYSPSTRSLNLCYELVAAMIRMAPETVTSDGFITRQPAIVGSVVGVLLHESGHMLFDMLDVPVFGREEDAADETANFIALQFNPDVARVVVKGFVWVWASQKDPAATDPMGVWADEHGKASQRMYNALCLGYGADPVTFKEFVDKGRLPQKRAEHCADEYRSVKDAFVTTVLPFIDQDLMKRVQAAEWLTPEEMK